VETGLSVVEERTRPVLSRELIAEAALRLTLDQPRASLTLARLGAELGADPTAIYRHFRNRDELLLHLVDRLFVESLEGFEPSPAWQGSLTELAERSRQALLRRPALAADAAWRFTGGPGERAAVTLLHSILCDAGFEPDEALEHVRAFGEMMLAHIVMTAASLSAGDAAHEADMVVAERLHGAKVLSTSYGYEAAAFALMLRVHIAGLEALLADRSSQPDLGQSDSTPHTREST
jgi:AcrR family transcriptional regulator